jgi:hypothetical protein
MNSIFSNKGKLKKKDKAEVITWMSNDQLWKPAAVVPGEAAEGDEAEGDAEGDEEGAE